jgi:hypothetical protein
MHVQGEYISKRIDKHFMNSDAPYLNEIHHDMNLARYNK